MFISTGINDSPVITGKAASQMANAAFYAAKFDDDGNITHAGKGENAIGLFIATTPELVNAGDDVTVQIKDIGLWVTGDAVAAGAELTSDANGAAVTAEQGDYVTAIALEAATAAGQVIKVQIVKSGINDSPVITGKATAAINNGAFLAVKFDGNGGIVLAGAGENALGLLIATTPENVAAGEDVTIQIKDIGLWKTGEAVAAGAELTPDANGAAVAANGAAVAAVAGKYVTAIALESATAAGQVIKVQIVKSGKLPA